MFLESILLLISSDLKIFHSLHPFHRTDHVIKWFLHHIERLSLRIPHILTFLVKRNKNLNRDRLKILFPQMLYCLWLWSLACVCISSCIYTEANRANKQENKDEVAEINSSQTFRMNLHTELKKFALNSEPK